MKKIDCNDCWNLIKNGIDGTVDLCTKQDIPVDPNKDRTDCKYHSDFDYRTFEKFCEGQK